MASTKSSLSISDTVYLERLTTDIKTIEQMVINTHGEKNVTLLMMCADIARRFHGKEICIYIYRERDI
jgi:hypothetical protein